jgi:hypothetical protein
MSPATYQAAAFAAAFLSLLAALPALRQRAPARVIEGVRTAIRRPS